jgi:alpha-L-fucosidase
MGMPTWWNERRYGLIVTTTIATVPAWAPIGQQSAWYRSHLGDDVADTRLQQQPMVEVVAHHRDRWGHIERFDDFLELLTFEQFDAEAWARLAVDAGMGYSLIVAKHHDGLCWWDAPAATRTVLDSGPKRNVLAEYAAACERNDLVFGTYYSLLDWSDDRYPDEDYVDNVLHPHVTDLVERYGSSVLWGDGNWGHGPECWKTKQLLDRLHEISPELIVNDRWGAADGIATGPPIVTTFDFDPPDDITPGAWELRRGIGYSLGHNGNERAEHHMSGYDIVALLTEVVAKGGHLLLSVGPTADGVIPDTQAGPLRDAGTWVHAHRDVINRSRPWTSWGDEHVRYLTVDGVLHVVDMSGRGEFPAIDPDTCRVVSVERVSAAGSEPIHFDQDHRGLRVNLPRSSPWRRSVLPIHGSLAVDVAVYRVALVAVDSPVELFAPIERSTIDLAPLVDDAAPGEIVQLGDGVYCGPATVPAGVILRGLGPSRTTIDGGGHVALTLGRNSRVEHLAITVSTDRDPASTAAAVAIRGQFASVLGCRVDGPVVVEADDVLIRATALTAARSEHANRLTVSRCQLHGNRWDTGIDLVGGADHEVDSCEIANHLCAIRATDTNGTVVRGNNVEGRWWGIHLQRTERAHVHGNQISHTMRAVDVDGGNSAVVEGNAVTDGDSGCIVERGATACHVAGNHWERCRIGLLAWEANDLRQQDNHIYSLFEPDAAFVTGP